MSEKISNRMMERNWSSKKDDEIERLREIVLFYSNENERLRELLKGVVDDMVFGKDWEHLLVQIKMEVEDEQDNRIS